MATIAKLAVEIGANTSKLSKGLKSAQSKVHNFGKTVSSVGSTLTLGLTAPIALAGGKMLQLAADAEETQNLFDVSFGKMAGQAEAFAKSMSKDLGLNQFAIKEQAAVLNDMTKSMGLSEQEAYKVATSMTTLTQDLASFKNLDIDEAFTKIQSGLSGEAEPLKRIGILVNDNTIKTWAYTHGLARQGEQLTEQQKVMARVGTIMEQTSDAQGDLARTSGSVTNQWRRLKARTTELATELGTNLLPYANQVLGKLLELADSFSGLSTSQQQVIIKTLAFVAAIGPSLKIIGLLTTAFSMIISPVGLVVAGIGLLIEKTIGFKKIFETAKTVVMGLYETFSLLSDGLPTAALIRFRKLLMTVFGRETGQTILTNILNIKENTINTFESIKVGVVEKLTPLINFVQELWITILEYWNANGEKIITAASNIFQGVIDIFTWAFTGIIEFVSTNSELIKTIISKSLDTILNIVDLFANIFTGNWEGAWENIKTITSNFFGEDGIIPNLFRLLKITIDAILQGLATATTTIFRVMFESTFGIIKAIFGDIVDFIAGKVEWIMGKVDAVKKAISKLVNTKVPVPKTTIQGRTRNEVSKSIPKLAQGGITTGPTLAMIGEGNENEAIIPLSKLDQMAQSGKQTIQVILDGNIIAEQIDSRQGNRVLRTRGAY